MKRIPALLLALAAATATTVSPSAAPAQPRIPVPPVVKQLRPGLPLPKQVEIPATHRPPPGMCRIWLDSVPPGQQPASTDCATAVRNRPANGRVLFGDDYVDGKEKRDAKDAKDAKDRSRPTTPPRPRPDSASADARHSVVPGVGVSGPVRFLAAAYVPAAYVPA